MLQKAIVFRITNKENSTDKASVNGTQYRPGTSCDGWIGNEKLIPASLTQSGQLCENCHSSGGLL